MSNKKEFINYINNNLKTFYKLNKKYKSKLKNKMISSVEEFEKLPFMEREDLKNIQIDSKIKYVRIHSTSGTTGEPIIIPYTNQDVSDWTNMVSRCYKFVGINKKDVIQIATGYGLWTAGIGFQLGCEKLGSMAIPIGCDSTDKQLEYFKKMKSTVLCSTASYAIYLAEKFKKEKIYLKKGIFGSEIWGEKTKKKIEKSLKIKCYDIYGMTETYGPGIAINCDKSNYMHYWNDYFYFEIIDPNTGQLLPKGQWGELVITTLKKEGLPLIRYRTHDITRIIENKCECGSKYPQIDKIVGRTDDMFKFHGVKLFPKEFEDVLLNFNELSPKYEIILKNENGKDVLYLRVEYDRLKYKKDLQPLNYFIKEEVKKKLGVTVEVIIEKKGTLPQVSGKSKHIFDLRKN